MLCGVLCRVMLYCDVIYHGVLCRGLGLLLCIASWRVVLYHDVSCCVVLCCGDRVVCRGVVCVVVCCVGVCCVVVFRSVLRC